MGSTKLAKRLLGALVAVAAAAVLGQASAQTCDLGGLKCRASSKDKCNIRFLNRTGAASGWGGGRLEQVTRAKTVRVSARDSAGNKVGANRLKILDTNDKRLNLDNKANFSKIRVQIIPKEASGLSRVTMSCDEVKKTLQGSGTCTVFVSEWQPTEAVFDASINCNGGQIIRTGRGE